MFSARESDGSRTILWCVPRSASTALMKCLSFIEESEVWSEPYSFCHGARVEYRRATDADIPKKYEDNEDIFQKAKGYLEAVCPTNLRPERIAYGSVKRQLEHTSSKRVFVRDMGYGMSKDTFQYLPKGYKHTFLICNPLRTIYSWRTNMVTRLKAAGRLHVEASTFDVERDFFEGFSPGCFVKELYDLWVYVKENFDIDPVVIDADDLLINPKETLSAYCTAVGLPYNDSLLQWDASTDVFKKIKASGDNLMFDMFVFGKAMRSSEFMPPSELPSRDQMTPDVIRCSERVVGYYDEMYKHRLNVF